ncbi:hypothetical protein SAMN05216266_1477 [Amycolatopsis marina]|uniref:Thymidylate kinase n=1 Tax=Amycolatopsis marina TaxID=490629 RepID=A0A1I1CPY5_9PSEU|nr:hypothetical protein [Amycolatopsis marina]SFB64755.1 hypothetical protein SAMN05216266_1477 [Amycolatopsis marina]
MRGCVLTGVWGAGKTSIYQRLAAQLIAQGCQSLITLPQAATLTTHTYAPGTPAKHAATIHSWLNNLTEFLEDLDHRFTSSSLPHHRFAGAWTPTCLLEGLGFDVPVYRLPLPRQSLIGIEHRLAAIRLRLVMLRVPTQQIFVRCIESTRVHRGPKWAAYVDSFGLNDAARTRYVEHAQDRLLRWAKTSPLPLHVLEVDTDDWDDHARALSDLITTPSQATRHQRHPTAPTPATDAHSPRASTGP